MENRHLCRGKRIDNGEWVEGSLVQTVAGSYIVVPYKRETILGEGSVIEIDPSTICWYTAMSDKNGELIWENDIVDFLGYKGTVVFECGSFGIAYKAPIDWNGIQANIMPITGCENLLYACENDNYISLWEIYWNFNDEDNSLNTVEVVGNAIDNPELLEGAENGTE